MASSRPCEHPEPDAYTDSVISRIDPEVRGSLTSSQLTAIRDAVGASSPPDTHSQHLWRQPQQSHAGVQSITSKPALHPSERGDTSTQHPPGMGVGNAPGKTLHRVALLMS